MSDLTIQTVLRNFLTKLVPMLFGWAGGALVSYGWATSDQVKQIVEPATQITIGLAMSGVSVAIAWYRAREKRTKELKLEAARPGSVIVK